jgi:hypothetical protein
MNWSSMSLSLSVARQLVQLHGSRFVAQHFLVARGFNHRLVRRRRCVFDRPRPRPRRLEERLVAFVRDHGDAFGDVFTQAACVIVVGMGIHDVPDRLARYGLADEIVDDLRTRVARRPFEHDDVIAELHGEAARARAVQRPETVADLVNGGHRRGRRGRR